MSYYYNMDIYFLSLYLLNIQSMCFVFVDDMQVTFQLISIWSHEIVKMIENEWDGIVRWKSHIYPQSPGSFMY